MKIYNIIFFNTLLNFLAHIVHSPILVNDIKGVLRYFWYYHNHLKQSANRSNESLLSQFSNEVWKIGSFQSTYTINNTTIQYNTKYITDFIRLLHNIHEHENDFVTRLSSSLKISHDESVNIFGKLKLKNNQPKKALIYIFTGRRVEMLITLNIRFIVLLSYAAKEIDYK